MSINGKRDRFTREDLIEVGEAISIPKPRLILDQVLDAVKQWLQFAAKAGVGRGRAAEIGLQHRL